MTQQKLRKFVSFSSFPKEIEKKEQIQIFFWLIIKKPAAKPEVVGGRAPCRVPTWVERAANYAVLKKIK